jgi:hypothetical protein
MAVENVKKFYEAVSQDESLKQKFVELSQKHQGEPMDEAKVMTLMEQEALPLAQQMGYSFTMNDLKVYGEEMNQTNMNSELSDSELEAVVGGQSLITFCYCFGIDAQTGDTHYAICLFFGAPPPF